MVLGRLTHYAIDAVLLSTVLAGVKRSTNFAFDTEFISNPTIRSITEQYLGFGETMFNALQGTIVTSPYFKRSSEQRR
ncbi:hypothetical protein F5148DRAFT_1294146 [Russula earlei]|uniref:Uncharacterized protein n=1 Tax=Russula earlei TaxID=71964 RepID=A0ACC0TRX8_9AGAM|nr:hypothetical protein F5148DRAFT_1294146 [Russula earlei]